ncbi:hypothetical protein [Micromonospora sp. CA-111912]|uniref:hypothetical protein n=1 Tax=Micromonospora sp. CA-111912 TaxID=3239955 RepID=UPI003D8BA31E
MLAQDRPDRQGEPVAVPQIASASAGISACAKGQLPMPAPGLARAWSASVVAGSAGKNASTASPETVTSSGVPIWFGFDAVMPSGYRPLLLVQRDEDSYRMAARFRAEQRQKGQHDGRS